MFNYKHYVPVLKAKEGEFKALQNSTDSTKDGMTPLLEVTDIPWDYVNDRPQKTIEDHINPIAKKLGDSWGKTRRIFVDSLLDDDLRMSDGTTHHLIYLFNSFRTAGINTIPVSGLDRHVDYKASVTQIITTDKKGLCLRLINDDLSKPNLKAEIDRDFGQYKITAKDTDLVIDLGSIQPEAGSSILLVLATIINNVIPYINDWRSLTVTASSFPIDLSEYSASSVFHTIDRVEWDIYNQLLTRVTRKPTYGDYTTSNPNAVEMDPRLMTISASIRYTSDNYWLIARGRSIKVHGSSQYHDLCGGLITRPEYCGATYSYGDGYIDQCASRSTGPGNPTTWRTVSCNHHFQKVVTQTSSLL